MIAGAQNRMIESRYERGCAGKDGYSSEAAADFALLMLKRGKKAEQQSLAKYGLNYVTDTYLPEKLSEMGVL